MLPLITKKQQQKKKNQKTKQQKKFTRRSERSPRKPKPPHNGPERTPFNQEALLLAVRDYIEGISASTALKDKADGKYKTNKVDRPTMISLQDETLICESLKNLASWGFGLTKVDITKLVKDYLDNVEPEKPHIVGKNWLKGFMEKFHHKLSLHKATNVPTTRHQANTYQCVNEFFNLVEEIYTKYDLKLKPHNIYNCGEIGLSRDHSICARRQFNPCKIQGNG